MQSIHDNGGFPPAPALFNMAAHVLTHSDTLADKIALEIVGASGTKQFTYQNIERAVRGTATGLLQLGLQAGDRVLLQLGNTPEFPITYLGAIAAGIVPVPISAQLTEPEVASICDTIQPALIIRAKGMAQISGNILSAEVLRDFWTLPPATYHMGDPERPAYIIYTSGTSGRPRAVVHAHRAIWARQMMWDGWYGLREGDRIMHAGAFNWTYTLGTGLMDPWSVGATALIPDNGTQLDQLAQLLAAHRATIFAAAPGVYRRLLRTDVPALPNLRHGLSAGEKLSDVDNAAWVAATGTPIYEAFGMSECSTFISGSPNKPAPTGTSGYPQPGRKVALIGTNGPVERNTPGTIAIHRDDPGLMLEYLNAPEETAARFSGDWFMTGDIGLMDDSGAITYAGRDDDMMNAGGYRVSPVEVENALNNHPLIAESAACAVQIRTGINIIAAFYVATSVVDDKQLRDWMATRLAGYKTPRIYIAIDALPRGANNKLLRRVLRENWEAENGQT